MAYGVDLTPGSLLYVLTTPVTTAASPVLSPWINTENFCQLYAIGVATTGTTVVTLEWSFDAATVDTDITATTISPLALTVTLRDVLAPFVRVKWAQTVSNATVSKLTVRAK
jgi:hypothetical protein